MHHKNDRSTSWQPVQKWYKDITKDKGHYYHEHVVIPGVISLLQLQAHDSVLDLACGSGVLGRAISKNVRYLGIDIARSLIEEAKRQDKKQKHDYLVGDITKNLEGLEAKEGREGLDKTERFSHATCVLALQNVEPFQEVFANASRFLNPSGTFVIVLNHPSFRIPRQSGWGIDEQSKLQYRRVNRYLSPLKIPISLHPSQERSPHTWSFHQPLSAYINGLSDAKFVVTRMEEWSSDKESEGKAGKMENRARAEIPLFMTLVAVRV